MAKLKTEYIYISDAQLAYRQCGNGPTLILLHGNSQCKKIFTKYQIHYFNNFHTFAIDSRGHEQSTSKNTDYSIDQYSSNIIEFCHATSIKNAYVIGYSDGGNIALLLAKKAPNLFTKIIAISPNYLVYGMKHG